MKRFRNTKYLVDENYNISKTEKELNEIKKQKTNNKNKENHLHKRGNKIIVDGVEYKSINFMANKYGYSFKYVKRRVESKDYKNWEYVK